MPHKSGIIGNTYILIQPIQNSAWIFFDRRDSSYSLKMLSLVVSGLSYIWGLQMETGCVCQWRDLILVGQSRFDPQQGRISFTFVIACRLTLGPNQSRTKWVPKTDFLSWFRKWNIVETYLYSITRLQGVLHEHRDKSTWVPLFSTKLIWNVFSFWHAICRWHDIP